MIFTISEVGLWGLMIAGVCFSLVALVLSGMALACVVGFKNSTHKIQYVPLENPFEETEAPAKGQDVPDSDTFLDYDASMDGGDWGPSLKRTKR